MFSCLQEDKKKKKSNKVVELPIVGRTHGYSQSEFEKYFELEVCILIAIAAFSINQQTVFVF